MALIPGNEELYYCRLGRAVLEARRAYESDAMLSYEWKSWLAGLKSGIKASAQDHSALVGYAFTTFSRTMHGLRDVPYSQRQNLNAKTDIQLHEAVRYLCAQSEDASRQAFDGYRFCSVENLIY